MCHLNILIKNDRKDYADFLMDVTSKSFVFNSHGDGVYFETETLVKQTSKINFYDYMRDIDNSNFIISHQRFATSGFCNDYTHPFESRNFVMVHNGIINVFLKNKGSDSSGFFEDFNKAFIKMLNLKVKRETAIVKCLKILLDGIEGSYSIALFDKDTKIMYYFKNDGTNINFYRFDNNLYITTSIENGKVLKDTYLGKVKEVEIKDFMIYKIFIKNKKVMIYELSKIVKPVFKEKKFDRCYLNPWVDDMRDEEVRETFSNYCTKFNNRIKYLEEETQSRLSEDEKFYLKAYRRGDY